MKLLLIVLFSIVFFTKVNAQNYAYTYGKIPLIEYIGLLLNNGESSNNQEVNGAVDGAFINTGYAFKLQSDFYLETGVDYLLLNRKGYKNISNTDANLPDNILDINNSALAFQLRPLWRKNISADDNTFFFATCGINFQKLFSKGSYTSYTQNYMGAVIETTYSSKAKSSYHLATQPEIGIEFRNEKKLGFRFGISHSYINWSITERKLSFPNSATLKLDNHKTSNIFFSFGFVY